MSDMEIELSDLATGMTSTIALEEPLPDFPDATHPGEFLNALPAAIYLTDTAGRITYFNEAAATMWGAGRNSTSICGAARGDFIGRTARRCRTTLAPWRSL
jgi:PAS domain-containing protein